MRVQDAMMSKEALTAMAASRSDELKATVASLRNAGEAGDVGRAAEAFESYFATMLVKELRRALPEGFFSGSGSDVYGAWFDEHIGRAISERDALGLAGLIKTSMAQANASEETTP